LIGLWSSSRNLHRDVAEKLIEDSGKLLLKDPFGKPFNSRTRLFEGEGQSETTSVRYSRLYCTADVN
jgi:hypothetical protein